MIFPLIAMAAISAASSLAANKQTTDANNKAGRLQAIANAQAQERREKGLSEQKDVLGGAEGRQLEQLDWGFGGQTDAVTQAALEAAENLLGGSAASTAELRAMQHANAPGMAMLRGLVGNPEELTEYQRRQQAEARRVAGNSIRNSSLGGSGRTASRLLKDVEADSTARFIDENRNKALTAAGMMAGNEATARGRIATNQQVLGQNLAQNASEAGGRLAGIFGDSAARKAGVIGNTAGQISGAIGSTYGANANTDEANGKAQANVATANGAANAQTTGAIGSILADTFRASKYNAGADSIRSGLGTTPGTGGLY